LSKKRIILIVFSIFVILLAAGIAYGGIKDKMESTPYETEDGYYSKGDFYKIVDYNDMVKKFGEPKIVKDENGYYWATYNDFGMGIGDTLTNSICNNVLILSSKYKFGKYNIGVGSSKIDVIKAYTSAGKYTFISCDGDPKVYHANDKGYVLTFYFDDKDDVSKIEFYWLGDYWTTHW